MPVDRHADPRSPPARRGVAALRWGLLFFAGGQALLLLILECWRPHLRDPEYDLRLTSLRARLANNKGRPLVVMLGTSRVAMGLRPGLLAANHEPSAQAPLVFNFGCCGATPVTELLCLRRLLESGIRPTHVVVEVWAQQLPYSAREQVDGLDLQRVNHHDLRLLRRYAEEPGRMCDRWYESQVLPCSGNRFALLSRLAPGWAGGDGSAGETWRGLDGWGWLSLERHRAFDPGKFQRGLDVLRPTFARCCERLRVSPASEVALRQLLATCRRRQIAVTLILLPEPGAIRGWYTPAARDTLNAFLGRLCGEFGAPVVDAREWVADDGFAEGVHLTHAGAAAFTRRFEQEWLFRVRKEDFNPPSDKSN
jgi:hypothetical protein